MRSSNCYAGVNTYKIWPIHFSHYIASLDQDSWEKHQNCPERDSLELPPSHFMVKYALVLADCGKGVLSYITLGVSSLLTQDHETD